MDPQTFDQHTRCLGQAISRRTVLARLDAGLLALFGGVPAEDSAAKPVTGQTCQRLGKRCPQGKRRRMLRCCSKARCRQGKCRCASTQKACRGQCIPATRCCTDRDCGGGGAICRNGTCRCPQGMQDCQDTCIPNTACCTNGDCGTCDSCQAGQCVSGCQAGQAYEAGVCRCTTSSCPGCCAGETCRAGEATGAWGVGGEACVDCGNHADCVGGACQCDAGFQDCSGACIPDHECCEGCPPGEVCVAGACVEAVCGNGGPCTVFVRQTPVRGSTIGGLVEADALCQASAAAAGSLAPAGTYRAWLSDATGSPAGRFMQSPGPYVLVDGTEVAANWDDLTGGTLAAPINRSETGDERNGDGWTNATSQGLPQSTSGNGPCGAWDGTTVMGYYGRSGHVNTDWTDAAAEKLCIVYDAQLYCFQQS